MVRKSSERSLGLLLVLILACTACAPRISPRPPEPPAKLVAQRHEFQVQEMITAKPFSFIFNVGDEPRIVWRDLARVRELGSNGELRARWFDADLKESSRPTHPGRWTAYIQGKAPNGTPVVRQTTFFARPNGFLFFGKPGPVPMDYQPGVATEQVWREHASEIAQVAGDARNKALNDSEAAAILLAGLSEAKPKGRPALSFETTAVRSDAMDLGIRMRVESLTPRPLQPPRRRASPAPVLRAGLCVRGRRGERREEAHRCRLSAVGGRLDGAVRDLGRPSWCDRHAQSVRSRSNHSEPPSDRISGRTSSRSPRRSPPCSSVDSSTKVCWDLDESVGGVFPNYPSGPHVPTFRQCLTHMSGLSGHGDFGGVRNPQLDNIVLNGIDANRPGQAYSYAGMGYDLTAKAMELTTGTCAMRLYHDALFEPLGIGDVPMENASSGARPTAMQLAVLAQWLANRGSYGEIEFISPITFQRMLPEPLDKRYPGVTNIEEGIGMHWMRRLKPGAAANSHDPKDLILSPNTIGHGSFSSSMLLVDLDRDLIIVQIRERAGPRFIDWSTQFLQTIVEAVD